MASWQKIIADLRLVQTEIMRIAPFRDLGLVPNPAAQPRSLNAAERRIGRTLPPSYRAFLAQHNGWPRFFDGASLLGTGDLGKHSYARMVRAVFEAAETPVPDLGPPSTPTGRPRAIIPFGIDTQATTLFAFNPEVVSADGEWEVIAWVNEIGIRRESFEEFLQMVLELADAELAALSAPIARSA